MFDDDSVHRASSYLYRKLYWTEDGSSGSGQARIAQSNLDGSGVRTLYGDVVRPTGLGIEFGLKEDRYDATTDNCDNRSLLCTVSK